METVTINKKARLSQHFTLGELCKTQNKLGEKYSPNRLEVWWIFRTFAAGGVRESSAPSEGALLRQKVCDASEVI